MDERVYRADAYRRTLVTEVIETGEADGRPWARVNGTIFHPEGGGQPADHGRMDEARVVDVQTAEGGRIFHVLDRPAALGPVTLEIDWARRYDHMQQHTGQSDGPNRFRRRRCQAERPAVPPASGERRRRARAPRHPIRPVRPEFPGRWVDRPK